MSACTGQCSSHAWNGIACETGVMLLYAIPPPFLCLFEVRIDHLCPFFFVHITTHHNILSPYSVLCVNNQGKDGKKEKAVGESLEKVQHPNPSTGTFSAVQRDTALRLCPLFREALIGGFISAR